MPFEKNNPYAKMGGRPGYEFEQAQLERMSRILNKDLSLIERLHDKIDKGEDLNAQEERILQVTATRISKIYDKLHASRETREHSGQISLPKPLLEINKDGILHNNGNQETSETK